MQLGLSNHPRFDISLEGFLNFASQLRAEHVELKLDCPFLLSALSNRDEIRGIKDLFASYSFKYFLHAPTIDINLASLNPSIGEASENVVLNSVYFADKVGVELIVSHVGRLSRDHLENLIDLAFRNAVSRLKRLVHVSEDLGITFTIENDHRSSDRVLAGYPKQVCSLIRALDCKLTFDVGHANTLGEIEGFLDSLGKEMVNIHLHDNDGVNDEHLPLGKGKINVESILEKIKVSVPSSPLTLECHSLRGLKRDMVFLKRIL